MDVDEILQARKSLSKALKDEKISVVLDIMNNLNERAIVTKELLKTTEIGVFIGKQRMHKNAEVAKLAKEIVKKWKTAVGSSDSPSPRPNGINGNSVKADSSDNKSTIKPSTPKENGKKPPKPINNSKPLQRESSQSSISSPTTPSAPDSERSFESDGVKATTNNPVRDKCVSLVYNALVTDSNVDASIILSRAIKIEQTIHNQFEGKAERNYRDKLRSLILNLKDKSNPNLRKRVVSGELTVEMFCTMSKEEMVSEDRKARNNEIRQANLFKARGAGQIQAETDAF
ncbi:1482_t:CDS:2, partial [Acaulospora colombiana]